MATTITTVREHEPPLLEVRDLCAFFPVHTGVLQRITSHVRAVDGVSFSLHTGETLGLVGESGCGKTTLGRTLLGLIPATSGDADSGPFGVPNVAARAAPAPAGVADHLQDPMGSLNPRLRIGTIVGEPLEVHGIARGAALRDRVADLLERCGLWRGAADRYPHELSGGQRQRIAIARAIALRPKLIVCDEPTSALDVSIQSQILNLLQDLQDEFGLSYLFISHDMAVINHVCDRIAVMRSGQIVEIGDREDVITNPQHDYTKRLLAAVPGVDPRRRTARVVATGATNG